MPDMPDAASFLSGIETLLQEKEEEALILFKEALAKDLELSVIRLGTGLSDKTASFFYMEKSWFSLQTCHLAQVWLGLQNCLKQLKEPPTMAITDLQAVLEPETKPDT